jgi:hydrogenase-4 component F
VVFIVISTLVGFTTSVFSASYIAHELETGHLTHAHLRFYHAMYQMLMFGMNLALLSNNVGLMWVAVELATLTTVVMVGIYRTPAALEAAWKYFLLGSVGIALALFGTILVYLAASTVVGEGLDAMAWNVLVANAHAFDPAILNLAFVFLLLGYGTKVGLVPLHAWLPTRTLKARRRSRQCSPGCCSTSRCSPCCASRASCRQIPRRSRPAR